jgi:hypothetical protein
VHIVFYFKDGTMPDRPDPAVDDETIGRSTNERVKVALTDLQGAISPDGSATRVVE